MAHRSDVKTPQEDCEMHIAGNLVGQAFGDPKAVVVEPPNLCKVMPGAASPVTGNTSTKATWRNLVDTKILGKT